MRFPHGLAYVAENFFGGFREPDKVTSYYLYPLGTYFFTKFKNIQNSWRTVLQRAETSPKIASSKNRKIAYNCIYIVNFRKIGKSENSEFSKIYNVNAVISDFLIFQNRYFGWCLCTLKDRVPTILNILEIGKKMAQMDVWVAKKTVPVV